MKPGVKTIIAGVLIFLTGVVGAPLMVAIPLILEEQSRRQFEVPGSTEILVPSPGRYYLWNDFRTVFNGKIYNRPVALPDGLQIHIREGSADELKFTGGNPASETSGSYSRETIGYVDVDRPGKLVVDVSGGSERRIFSFSRGSLPSFVMFVAILGFSFTLGIVGAGVVYWGNRKLIKAKRAAASGPITLGGLKWP